MLDYALNDPPSAKTKEVVAYLDAKGGPSSAEKAVFAIKGLVTTDSDVHKILSKRELSIFNEEIPERDLLEKYRQRRELIPAIPPEGTLPAPAQQQMQMFQEELKSYRKDNPDISPQGSAESITPQRRLTVPPTPTDQLLLQGLQRVGAGF